MSQHFMEVYECGHVGGQCRCPDLNKTQIKKEGLCPKCLNDFLLQGKDSNVPLKHSDKN